MKVWMQWLVITLVVALAGALLALAAASGGRDRSTVGGTEVPDALACEEDEAISWIGIDRLGCVHAEGNLLEPTPWARTPAPATPTPTATVTSVPPPEPTTEVR